ncbi:MAG: ABC-2 family transporter protein [Spirochaetia bacterium]|jgi:ABC-2 type transport system permease protein
MRAYLELAKKSFQEMLSSRGEALLRLLAMLLSLYLLYTFWKGLYANAAEVQGITFNEMLTYAILSAVTGGILNIFGLLQVYIAYWMARKMRSGEIVMDMLRPTDFQLSLFSNSTGRFVFNLIISVPVVCFAFLVFKLAPPSGLQALLFFLASLAISYLLVFLIDFLVSLIAFWTTQTRGVGGFTRLIIALLSGSFIPLWFFPAWARDALSWLPFASIYHAPLSIFIGKLQGADAVRTIVVQVAWVIILFSLSRLLWARSRRHLMIHAG